MEWPSDLSRLYVRLVDIVKSPSKTEAYQRNVSALYNSIVGYLKKDGVVAAISGKYGIFRNLMLGKRLNRSVRLVIAGDPNLDIDEILVPKSVTNRVRIPERVWNGNIVKMKEHARNGQLWYASEEVQVEDSEIIVGQVYDRVLCDGDWVTLNRQPSLSKTSLLAMRIKVGVVENNIFAFNPCITTAFNADFDGDEMNIYTGNNPLAVMLHSGAKGKDIGPSQMAISLGQQYVNGKIVRARMKNNFPHDTGFVSSGYVKGLTSKEYFSQASASLGGIIDIGVGVSAIGYTNRRVTKLMAGVEMGYNGGVSTDGQVVRF
ncbi:hypothetical protein BGX28_005535 [Mortierella sp. GBA30]|nr:hypothetical protein BGX28_005535 [Mortierella sp. GBA30]